MPYTRKLIILVYFYAIITGRKITFSFPVAEEASIIFGAVASTLMFLGRIGACSSNY